MIIIFFVVNASTNYTVLSVLTFLILYREDATHACVLLI